MGAMIAIIDYKAGNLTSVKLALEYIGVECEITDQPERIAGGRAGHIPGRGRGRRGYEVPAGA